MKQKQCVDDNDFCGKICGRYYRVDLDENAHVQGQAAQKGPCSTASVNDMDAMT